jgi:hypothetical protein
MPPHGASTKRTHTSLGPHLLRRGNHPRPSRSPGDFENSALIVGLGNILGPLAEKCHRLIIKNFLGLLKVSAGSSWVFKLSGFGKTKGLV